MASISRMITVIHRCSLLFKNEKLDKYGLNGFQYSYILNICKNPGISQDNLAKLVYINKSTAARQLVNLEAAGFIERRQDEGDRRVMLVYPTQQAVDSVPHIKNVLRDWNGFLTESFEPEELDIFNNLLEKAYIHAMDYADMEIRESED